MSNQTMKSTVTDKSVAPKSARVRVGKKRPPTKPEAAHCNEHNVEEQHVTGAVKRTRKVLNKKKEKVLTLFTLTMGVWQILLP